MALIVSGSGWAERGQHLHGTYVKTAEVYHGMPVYKRAEPMNDVGYLLYFYDERDGPHFSGWWFGRSLGGEEVSAFNPNREGQLPPPSGWRVMPAFGEIYEDFVVGAVTVDNGQSNGKGEGKRSKWSGPYTDEHGREY